MKQSTGSTWFGTPCANAVIGVLSVITSTSAIVSARLGSLRRSLARYRVDLKGLLIIDPCPPNVDKLVYSAFLKAIRR